MLRNKLKKIMLTTIATLWIVNVQANPLHNASDIVKLQAACVYAWEKIDKTIPEYNAFSITPWPNLADKEKFIEFEDAFKLSYSRTGSHDYDRMADDALLVASECTKMHNLIVNAHFNRQTGPLPIWSKRFKVTAILQLLLMD